MAVQAWNEIVRDYFRLFVNRRAYTIQAARPDPETGRHYYYRPTACGHGQAIARGEGSYTDLFRRPE